LFATFGRPGPAAPLTLAVLPFGNTNNDSALTFVTEGLAEEVATALARVPGIVIKSRSGARAYRGQLSPDVGEAGTRLKATHIMTGVVRQDRGRWIVSADLARAEDAASLWSENFALDPDQQAGAAEQIAASVASTLRSRFPGLVGAAPDLAMNQRTSNNEAYRLWLRGQEKLSRRGKSVSESADLFRQAIHLDTAYARAYSGLSMALALYPHFEGVPPSEVRGALTSAAERALQLDPSLAQPHIALGLAHQFAYQWDSAATEFERAVQLDGHSVEARVQYARHLLFRGRTADAMEQLMTARAEDPASALLLSWISYAYYLGGRVDSALAESRRAIENDPENFTTMTFGAIIRIGAGLLDEARALHPRQPPGSSTRTWILAKAGDTAAARAHLMAEDAESPQPWLAETRRAFGNLGLGDTARALTALERATDANEIWSSMQPVTDPLFDDLRASPRFQAVVRRVGLSDPGSRRRR
jgi:TolB-like protein